MTDAAARCIREQPRFRGIFKDHGTFDRKIALTLPVVHGDESEFIEKSLRTGFSGDNISELEKETAKFIGTRNGVALKSGIDAIHMAVKLAAEKIYDRTSGTSDGFWKDGMLSGKRVFCSDFMPPAAVNTVIYEGGEPVFIDVSAEDWCMDPEVLEIAFQKYPDVKLVIMNHAYGFPGQIKEVKKICREHGALLIEDASESIGAKIDGQQSGSFGDYAILDFGKDKIITGSSGGMLLVHDPCSYKKAKSWAADSDAASSFDKYKWMDHGCIMSDVVAGVVRSQLKHLEEHITKKKTIYRKYLEKFDGDFISMNPIGEGTVPNYWISCIASESNIQFKETRSGWDYTYTDQHGTAAPMEIYDALAAFGAESCPVYRPLSLYSAFKSFDQITLDGSRRSWEFDQDAFWVRSNVSKECFDRGLCLPSNIRMTGEEQDRVIDLVYACFCKNDLDRRNGWAI